MIDKLGAVSMFGLMRLRADRSLAETAAILSEILNINLAFDDDGRFEEFPAYMQTEGGLRYALLGIPEPDFDVRENPTNDYELWVDPIDYSKDIENVDVTDKFVTIINSDGRLVSWPAT